MNVKIIKEFFQRGFADESCWLLSPCGVLSLSRSGVLLKNIYNLYNNILWGQCHTVRNIVNNPQNDILDNDFYILVARSCVNRLTTCLFCNLNVNVFLIVIPFLRTFSLFHNYFVFRLTQRKRRIRFPGQHRDIFFRAWNVFLWKRT